MAAAALAAAPALAALDHLATRFGRANALDRAATVPVLVRAAQWVGLNPSAAFLTPLAPLRLSTPVSPSGTRSPWWAAWRSRRGRGGERVGLSPILPAFCPSLMLPLSPLCPLHSVNVGGKLLTNLLKEVLSYRAFDLMSETHLVNDIKEAACFVSQRFDEDMELCKAGRKPNNPHWRDFVLPNRVDVLRGYVVVRGRHTHTPRASWGTRVSWPAPLTHTHTGPRDVGRRQGARRGRGRGRGWGR